MPATEGRRSALRLHQSHGRQGHDGTAASRNQRVLGSSHLQRSRSLTTLKQVTPNKAFHGRRSSPCGLGPRRERRRWTSNRRSHVQTVAHGARRFWQRSAHGVCASIWIQSVAEPSAAMKASNVPNSWFQGAPAHVNRRVSHQGQTGELAEERRCMR